MKIGINTGKKLNFTKICVALALYTSSFDIVGVINIYGFNFRFSQFVCLPIILGGCLCLFVKRKIILPIGWRCILLWIALQFIFIFRSPDLKNAIGYFLWLIFDIIIIFSIVNHLNIAFSFQWLIRVYMKSFVFVSILGLIQFVLYPLGINFYVTQSWSDSLARINGFCYEPSYYATYLLLGFVIYSYLLKQKNTDIFPSKVLKRDLIIISSALIFSSSRMGWLMVVLWIATMLILDYGQLFINGLSKKRAMMLIVGVPLIFLTIGIIYFFVIIDKVDDFRFLFQGLGILGTVSHSSSQRIARLILCLEIFKNSPILGYSLGGVDPIIAQYMGIFYSTLNNGYGSLIGELLVGNGAVGIIPFLFYLKKLFKSRYNKLVKNNTVIHKALIWSLVFELIILCFNQNILRPYLWMHIAVLSASANNYINDSNM